MMDESALRLLQQTAIGDYTGKQERLVGTGTIALPDNFQLLNLEGYQPGRSRFRGKLVTESLADFASYTKDNHGEACFIDAEKLTARTFFNLGTKEAPGHGDWTASLGLKSTAAYAAVSQANGYRFDQRGLIDWLEDWRDAGSIYAIAEEGDAASYGTLSKAVSAIRAIKITATSEAESTQKNFGSTRSTLDNVEASSALGLPAGFAFTCEPYVGLPLRTFVLKLSVLTGGKDPVLVLRVMQLEAHAEGIVRDFKAALLRELPDSVNVTIGTFTV